MERKICTRCNVEKNFEGFYKQHTECKTCNSNRSLKRYYENEDEITNQKKIFYEKNRKKNNTKTKQYKL